nr:MFS transporter [Salinirubrum litoreum]
MLAHGMVHTYELSIPIFLTVWLVEFSVIDFGVAQFPVNAATLGVVLTAGYGLFGVGALPGGVLVDRIGSRRLITACLLGMAGSFLLLFLAPGVPTITLALLVWGASASVYHPAGLAMISKGVEQRGTGFAYHGIAGNVGIGLGPLLSAILLLFFDWRVVAGLLAVPAIAAAVFAVRVDFDETAAVATDGGEETGAESAHEDATTTDDSATTDDSDSKASAGVDSLGEFLTESRLLFAGGFTAVFVVVMCSGLYYRGVLTFLPGLLESYPGFEPIPVSSLLPASLADLLGLTAESGRAIEPNRYFYSGLLIIGVVGQYLGGKLTDRIPVEWGIAGGFGALAVLAVVFLPVASLGLAPLLVLGALLGVALFVVQPFYQATVAEYTPAGTRGLSYGYTYLGVFGVGALGTTVAGTILTYASPTVLFATLAGFGALAAVIGVVLARR